MNGMALLGILAIVYALVVVYIAAKKPDKIWNIAKIRMFKKVLGEKGTVIFFYILALVIAVLGIWLLMM
ncbi:MAG: hypothetical protein J7L15_09235 [Clostridiales bacterium]|nr:hypothetical protein [Clostridiales bacterium]